MKFKTGDVVKKKGDSRNFGIVSHDGLVYSLYNISITPKDGNEYHCEEFECLATEDELELVWSTNE